LLCQFTRWGNDDSSNIRWSCSGISLSMGKLRVLAQNILDGWKEETEGFTSTSSRLRNTVDS
jgi:hypothetical protein